MKAVSQTTSGFSQTMSTFNPDETPPTPKALPAQNLASTSNLASTRSHAKSKTVLLNEDGKLEELAATTSTITTAESQSQQQQQQQQQKRSIAESLFVALSRGKTNKISPANKDTIFSSSGTAIRSKELQGSDASVKSITTSPTAAVASSGPAKSEFSGRCSVSSRHQIPADATETQSFAAVGEVPSVPTLPADVTLARTKSMALSMKKSVSSLLHPRKKSLNDVDAQGIFMADHNAPQVPHPQTKSVIGKNFDFLSKPVEDITSTEGDGALSKNKSTTKSMPKISLFARKSMKSLRSATEQPSKPLTDLKAVSSFKLDSATKGQSMENALNSMSPEKRTAGLSAYEISSPQVHKGSYCLDDFQIIRKAGKGGFATVFLVRMKAASGRYYALKAIKKGDLIKLKQEKQVINEKAILSKIKHNFIVDLYFTFQDTYYLYMIIEYIDGGDLFSYLRKVQKFGEEDGRFYTCEVLVALQFIHSHNIVYRDLKPENILLDTTGHIKLADFGFAKVVTSTTNSFCGTPDYIAREIVRNRAYTKAVDWWSFGVLIFELVSGKTPFGDDSSEQIYENITEMRIKWHPMIKGACKELVRKLLEPDPSKRLGSGEADGNEIRAHTFYSKTEWQRVEERRVTPPFLPACDTPETLERRMKRQSGDDYAAQLKSGSGCIKPVGAPPEMFSDAFKGF
ncbi:camp-dependent protein kinase catalytic subunit [Entophlyctis luteolus]|nr:camp-dependent protein kinase catalytic subunit [Entophlyctis luteolus]